MQFNKFIEKNKFLPSRVHGFVNLKRKIKTVLFIFSLLFFTVGGVYLALKYTATPLYAQASSYWNVERDGSNNLNFYYINNGAAQRTGLQLHPGGGISNGAVGVDSGIVAGARYYDYLYQEGGPWTSPFPDLVLGYHTGLKIGANPAYNGVRFYNDHPSVSTTQLFSVGDGDNNVRVAYDLHFPNLGYGLRSANNGAYFGPNNLSYGAWRLAGNRNGWGGIEFDAPTTPTSQVTFMVGNPAHSPSNIYTGMHLNGSGWLWYATGHDLHAGDASPANGNIPAMPAGNVFGNIFYDNTNTGYYLDPAGSSNLNGATFASGPYTNDWFRANGNNGLYFSTYGGGWHMLDTTYIRSYGNKPILAPSLYDQDNAGYYVDPSNMTYINSMIVGSRAIVGSTSAPAGARLEVTNGSDGIAMGQIHGDNTQTMQTYIDGHWGDRASYAGGCCNKLFIQPDVGEVGIGTTNPQGKLSVGFGNGDLINMYQPSDDSLAIQTTLNNQPNNGYGGHGANRLVLQPTVGFVGIKTSNPTADLHIKQSDQSQWGGGGIKLERSSSGYARIFMGDDQQLYLFTNSNSHWCIVTLSASISCASDGRLKKDISPLNVAALDIINKLKPSTFTWKAGGKHSAGFIAQEVEEVLPEAVIKNEADGYLSISDSYITPYLVKSIQELDAKTSQIEQKTNEHTDQIKALSEQVNTQQAEIEYLKQEIEELKKR